MNPKLKPSDPDGKLDFLFKKSINQHFVVNIINIIKGYIIQLDLRPITSFKSSLKELSYLLFNQLLIFAPTTINKQPIKLVPHPPPFNDRVKEL